MSTKLLINEPPLMILPTLAKYIGLNEAIFLQQVHYWLVNPKIGKRDESGIKWVRNSLKEWEEENFPFWNKQIILRTIANLEEDDLIKTTSDMNKFENDKTNWYTVNYNTLSQLSEKVPRLQKISKTRKVAGKQSAEKMRKKRILDEVVTKCYQGSNKLLPTWEQNVTNVTRDYHETTQTLGDFEKQKSQKGDSDESESEDNSSQLSPNQPTDTDETNIINQPTLEEHDESRAQKISFDDLKSAAHQNRSSDAAPKSDSMLGKVMRGESLSAEEELGILAAGSTEFFSIHKGLRREYDYAENRYQNAGWNIRVEDIKHTAIHFLAATGWSTLPRAKTGTYNLWYKTFKEHKEQFDMDELYDLYFWVHTSTTFDKSGPQSYTKSMIGRKEKLSKQQQRTPPSSDDDPQLIF